MFSLGFLFYMRSCEMLFKGRILVYFKRLHFPLVFMLEVAVYAVETLLTMRVSVLGCRAKRQKQKPLGALVLALLCLTKRTRRGSLSSGT